MAILRGPNHAPSSAGSSFFESFQTQAIEIADVSLALETIASCKYPTRKASLRNRAQEADGSIPFISTRSLLFCLTRGSAGTKVPDRYSFWW